MSINKRKYKIYKVSIENIDSVISLRLALLKELGEIKSHEEELIIVNSTRDYLEEALVNNEFISYIAEINGEVVSIGSMVIFRRPSYLENLQGIEAYILNMYTLSEHRGNGLGRRILENITEESKINGAKRIWLHASEDDKYLYEKMGFTMKNNEMELFL
ncbi:GNAT family N-acetyltransferase [Viridibacillus arvi]|uniref:Acetyltransferase n=1 Tax=Viridibacillus arvi TaxID=263475 RepID=A0A0M0LCS1_9BACL|nr:GNAT family N-acetyltransferase [Viridibacillus arvi]KOO48786.1 acetyltransferase [Viridibacillus arvi]